MQFQTIILEIENKIVILKINRPEKMNALNSVVMNELDIAFNTLRDDNSVLAIIVTGTGEKAFVAGADIMELNKLNYETGINFARHGQNIFNRIENMNKPVIAAVNGFALGGGCELALACHIRIASDNAKFGQPEINLGLIPGYGGTQRLAQLVGKGRAMEYILTGDMISADEALRIGLVNKVYPQTELLIRTKEIANKITTKSSITVQRVIKSLNTDQEILNKGLAMEANLFGECCASEDFKEGTKAFLEKRNPEFRNK